MCEQFTEIYARGKFEREEVVQALETHDGNVDAAFLELNKSQLQPFMMRIWGSREVSFAAVHRPLPWATLWLLHLCVCMVVFFNLACLNVCAILQIFF